MIFKKQKQKEKKTLSQIVLSVLTLKTGKSQKGLRRFQEIFYTLDTTQFIYPQVFGDLVATLPH